MKAVVLAICVAAYPADAVAGWYLLRPPIAVAKDPKDDDPYAFIHLAKAPLSQWYRLRVFDTAKECRAERKRLVKQTQAEADQQRGPAGDKPMWLAFRIAELGSAEASECVASDDPRLLK
jgi:hypothetical protein